jgi:hypothetical protein
MVPYRLSDIAYLKPDFRLPTFLAVCSVVTRVKIGPYKALTTFKREAGLTLRSTFG